MNVIRSISQLSEALTVIRKQNESVGFVPTMGFLHEGHLSLVRASKRANNSTVVSIFVNPLQFNSAEDLEKYPRNEEKDLDLLKNEGVDIVFIPSKEEVYPSTLSVSLSVNSIEDRLEGFYRPGHFNGVGIIVTKLLNYVQPDQAYFGLKDLQQFIIIKKIVHEMSIPVEIVGVPTVRSSDGLALSSRNSRLTDGGLLEAAKIFAGLSVGREHLLRYRDPKQTSEYIRMYYRQHPSIKLEYLAIIDPDSFEEIETFSPDNSVAICVAAYVESIRLIDNLYLRPDSPE